MVLLPQTFCSVSETRNLATEVDFKHFQATIECQQPIADLYHFLGRIIINTNSGTITQPLGAENVLLRGSRLKNTSFIYGKQLTSGVSGNYFSAAFEICLDLFFPITATLKNQRIQSVKLVQLDSETT